MAEHQTRSQQLRHKGNMYFGQATSVDPGDSRDSMLKLSRKLYQKALDEAGNQGDRASAYKNLAQATMQLIDSALERAEEDPTEECMHLYATCLHHRSNSILFGFFSKDQGWMDSSWAAISSCINSMHEQAWGGLIDPSTMRPTLRLLLRGLDSIPSELSAVRLWFIRRLITMIRSLCERLLSDPADKGADWQGCLQLLAECQPLLVEGLQHAVEMGDESGVQQLLEDEQALRNIRCRCESAQACVQGDDLLLQALKLNERQEASAQQVPAGDAPDVQGVRDQHPAKKCSKSGFRPKANTKDPARDQTGGGSNARGAPDQRRAKQQQGGDNSNHVLVVEGLLAAADACQAAVQLVRGVDKEAEAQAASKLGHLYKVSAELLDPWFRAQGGRCCQARARDSFKRVLQLVEDLPTRGRLFNQPWYKEAREEVQRYQQSVVDQDEQEREQQRAPIRELLQEELAAVSAAARKGWAELLKHVYAKHPPVIPDHRLAVNQVFNADTGKQLLKAAILAYHPDKQVGQPLKWCVLCEEIIKDLNRKYESFK